MESIEKLREFAPKNVAGVRSELLLLADEIEREIAERYMELPVDADGVPIHVGDRLHGVYETFEVCAVSEHYAYWAEGKHWDKASECRHVKPDTVESLLEEFCRELGKRGLFDSYGVICCNGIVSEYADKLREVMR